VDTDLSVFLYWLGQETSPLVDYYKEKGVLETFQGTESDKIYSKLKQWLEARICYVSTSHAGLLSCCEINKKRSEEDGTEMPL
jgi:hypothetical protein